MQCKAFLTVCFQVVRAKCRIKKGEGWSVFNNPDCILKQCKDLHLPYATKFLKNYDLSQCCCPTSFCFGFFPHSCKTYLVSKTLENWGTSYLSVVYFLNTMKCLWIHKMESNLRKHFLNVNIRKQTCILHVIAIEYRIANYLFELK